MQEAVSDTLEELWISYNNIEKLKGINVLKKLKVQYASHEPASSKIFIICYWIIVISSNKQGSLHVKQSSEVIWRIPKTGKTTRENLTSLSLRYFTFDSYNNVDQR